MASVPSDVPEGDQSVPPSDVALLSTDLQSVGVDPAHIRRKATER